MILDIAFAAFILSGIMASSRLLRGPSLADRVIALDVTLMAFMGAVTIDAIRRNDLTNLVVSVVLAIIGFTATVAAGRFGEMGDDPIGSSAGGE